MPIREHPHKGTIVMCDFNTGFNAPEMVKRRPVVVISPKIKARTGLCTIVCLSQTAPDPVMPYHCIITLPTSFPTKLREGDTWLKGDMIYSVSCERLDFIRKKNGDCYI